MEMIRFCTSGISNAGLLTWAVYCDSEGDAGRAGLPEARVLRPLAHPRSLVQQRTDTSAQPNSEGSFGPPGIERGWPA